jgi:hypothetical protein
LLAALHLDEAPLAKFPNAIEEDRREMTVL